MPSSSHHSFFVSLALEITYFVFPLGADNRADHGGEEAQEADQEALHSQGHAHAARTVRFCGDLSSRVTRD